MTVPICCAASASPTRSLACSSVVTSSKWSCPSPYDSQQIGAQQASVELVRVLDRRSERRAHVVVGHGAAGERFARVDEEALRHRQICGLLAHNLAPLLPDDVDEISDTSCVRNSKQRDARAARPRPGSSHLQPPALLCVLTHPLQVCWRRRLTPATNPRPRCCLEKPSMDEAR